MNLNGWPFVAHPISVKYGWEGRVWLLGCITPLSSLMTSDCINGRDRGDTECLQCSAAVYNVYEPV